MKNFNLIKLLKTNNSKSANQGFTLTELLVALVMTSIILAVAAQGTASLFKSENNLNAKNTRRAELTRALAYMQNEINSGFSVAVETSGCSGTGVSSTCLRINTNAAGTTYVRYAFQDINSGPQTWLKPGVLRRQVDGAVTTSSPVLVDGLTLTTIGSNTMIPTAPTCSAGLSGPNGDNGFRFCIGNETPQKRAQIFLYGYIGPASNRDLIALNMLAFAQSN